MDTSKLPEHIITRKEGAAKLRGQLKPGTPEFIRAEVTANVLALLKPETTLEDIAARKASAAATREAAKRFSPEWIAADATFDAMVALETDVATDNAPAEQPAVG